MNFFEGFSSDKYEWLPSLAGNNFKLFQVDRIDESLVRFLEKHYIHLLFFDGRECFGDFLLFLQKGFIKEHIHEVYKWINLLFIYRLDVIDFENQNQNGFIAHKVKCLTSFDLLLFTLESFDFWNTCLENLGPLFFELLLIQQHAVLNPNSGIVKWGVSLLLHFLVNLP